MHKIISEFEIESIFDLIITDNSVLRTESVQVREDLKFSFNQGFRDLASSLPKMEDLSKDIALSKVTKMTELP